jgi:hypothetical protein
MTKDDFGDGEKFFFSFLKASKPVLRSNWPPILWEWRSFLGDKSGRYVKLTINPHLVPSSRTLEVRNIATSPFIHREHSSNSTIFSSLALFFQLNSNCQKIVFFFMCNGYKHCLYAKSVCLC